MKWVLAISFGELMLKGKNRGQFERKAQKQVLKAVGDIEIEKYFNQQGKFYLQANKEDFPEIISRVKKVFGISYITPSIMTDKNDESIKAALKLLIEEEYSNETFSFKVKTNRIDKSYPKKSPEISAQMGGYLLSEFDHLKVDIKKPEKQIYIDIRSDAFVYIDRVSGIGGLPMGTGGKALLLLSGGIDSPVAGFEMARKGIQVSALHFHSYPFTSERAEDKVKRLAEQMSIYMGDINYYSINLLEIYTAINKNCRPRFTTVIARRFMMRIGEELADRYGYDGFITGESLGQVASQTIQGISVVNDAAKRPILRPLINMDKQDIIHIAKDIETFDISIEPYDDCCSFFAPDRPATKPRLSDIEREESNLEIDLLVKNALETLKIETITI